jgi:hypothetical protein
LSSCLSCFDSSIDSLSCDSAIRPSRGPIPAHSRWSYWTTSKSRVKVTSQSMCWQNYTAIFEYGPTEIKRSCLVPKLRQIVFRSGMDERLVTLARRELANSCFFFNDSFRPQSDRYREFWYEDLWRSPFLRETRVQGNWYFGLSRSFFRQKWGQKRREIVSEAVSYWQNRWCKAILISIQTIEMLWEVTRQKELQIV